MYPIVSVYFSSNTSIIVIIDGKESIYIPFVFREAFLGKYRLNNTDNTGNAKYSKVKLVREA